jgi:hypothetical protein
VPFIRKKESRPASYEYKGTQNAENHLWKAHGNWDPTGKRIAPSTKKGGKRVFASASDFWQLNRHDPKEQAIANSMIKHFDRGHFQRLLVNWIVDSNLSFRQAENPRLRSIFEYLNPSVAVRDAHISRQTIRRIAVRQFEAHKDGVKEALRAAPGQVHIAFDGARTRNRHTLYGITAVYRDSSNQPQKVVLGLPELINRHTDEHIATEMLDVIRFFDLEDKVGYFTLDNAGNNDTAMAIIGGQLGFNHLHRRARCVGHIINLVVKALLFGKDVEAFDESIEKGELLARAAHDEWMKKGPVGKVHNWVVWVHRSDVLTNLLKQLQQDSIDASTDPEVQKLRPLEVILDNDTRWLSQYYMIKRALKLQPFYEEFMLKAKKVFQEARKGQTGIKIPACLEAKSMINDNDWEVLRAFDGILDDFHVVIKVLQGDGQVRKRRFGTNEAFGRMTDVLEAFEFLLGKLEMAKALIKDYPEPEHFAVNVNLGWAKLDKYYRYLKESPVYYAATALNPALRWGYFEDVWKEEHPDWIDEARELVQSLWVSEYRELQLKVTADEVPVAKKRKTKLSSFDIYREANRRTHSPRPSPLAPNQPTMDEYARWQLDVSATDSDIEDPLQYWISKATDYPRLSRMALDVMTVPAMSAECERLFSAVGLMATSLRSRLDASTIGLIQVLRSWLRAGLMESLDEVLTDDGWLETLLKVEEAQGVDSGADD